MSLNISDFSIFSMQKLNPPAERGGAGEVHYFRSSKTIVGTPFQGFPQGRNLMVGGLKSIHGRSMGGLKCILKMPVKEFI